MKSFIFKVNETTPKNENQWSLQTSLPEAKSSIISSNNGRTTRVLITVVVILFFIIMILTKLFPCINVSWPQGFCDRWNEFWFSLSASIVAAYIFYLFFTIIPSREKRKEIEPLIHYDLCSILIHLNLMFVVATHKLISFDNITKDSFIDEMTKWNWENKYPYVFNNYEEISFLDCIKKETEYAHSKLESIQKAYNSYFNSEELSIISHTLIHHDIFTKTQISSKINEDSKNSISSSLYDFYWTLIDFSLRYKTSLDKQLFRL